MPSYRILSAIVLICLSCACRKESNPVPGIQPIQPPSTAGRLSLSDSVFVLLPGMNTEIQAVFPRTADSSLGVAWTVSDSSVAEISQQGILRAKKQGHSYIISRDRRNTVANDSADLFVLGEPSIHFAGTTGDRASKMIPLA